MYPAKLLEYDIFGVNNFANVTGMVPVYMVVFQFFDIAVLRGTRRLLAATALAILYIIVLTVCIIIVKFYMGHFGDYALLLHVFWALHFRLVSLKDA